MAFCGVFGVGRSNFVRHRVTPRLDGAPNRATTQDRAGIPIVAFESTNREIGDLD